MISNYKKIDIKTKKLLWNLFLWNYKTAFKWRGLEFSDFRLYDTWDDSKRIDRLVSAREGKTLVRRYEEDRELDILFVIDISSSMSFWLWDKKKSDTLEEIFYLLWLSAIEWGSKIWAYIIWWDRDIFLNFKKWKAHLINIFSNIENWILKWKKDDKENYIDLSWIMKQKPKNKLIFMMTDKLDIDYKNFKVLSYKNDLVYINIFDNFENTLSWYEWIYGFWKFAENLFIDLSDEARIEEYKLLRKTKIDKLKERIYKYGADYLYLDNKVNIFKKLLLFMKKRQTYS